MHSAYKSTANTTKGIRIRVFSAAEVEKWLSMKEALEVVERAFKLDAEGVVIMPPKLYLDLPQYHGDFRAMPAYADNAAGLKWVSVYPNNVANHLQTVVATIIYSDPKTGYPLAIMDGTYITRLRTGAAGGVAAKYLARSNSQVIGIIGARAQAETQLLALKEVIPAIKEVRVFSLSAETATDYARRMGDMLELDVRPVKTAEQAADVDILVTTTPSREPVIRKEYVKPGTHINAIGADAEGKQEIDPILLKGTKLVVDNVEQASHSGEINMALTEGQIKSEDIYGTIGEIVAGMKVGRTNDDEITLFDSTGLAIQDIVCAKYVYERGAGAKAVFL